jgi:DNA invertase Pin-like site-specific DNA recombinase
MIRQVLSAIAEYERKLIGLRTSFAMRQHQKNGKRMGRHAPYGFEIDPESLVAHDADPDNNPTRLRPVPDEQEAIEEIRLAHQMGKNPHAIARMLNEEMPDAARGSCWRSKLVGRIIERL